MDDNVRGPNFWKLNQTLLNDAVYTENITNLINDKWKQYSHINDLRVRWDLLKFEIQTFSMNYAKNKAKVRKQEEIRSWETVNRIDKGSSIKYVRTEGGRGGLGRCVRIAYTGGGGGPSCCVRTHFFLNIQQIYLYLINIIL